MSYPAFHSGLPHLTWPAAEAAREMPCPNCGAPGAKRILVAVSWRPVGKPPRQSDVLACPACDVAFYDDLTPLDYADPDIAEAGRAAFFLQQGTALWHSAGLLARIARPAGTRYLEVGCGLGFALDFAIHGLGWLGHGFDPSPLAGVGRARLGLPITLDYFSGTTPGSIDVLLAAEVIEHVPAPSAFLTLLASSLKSDGILVLTTPDAAAIRPQTSSGALIPLLSPGQHLILQGRKSLARLLKEAGFAHVVVEHDAFSLIAFASRAPLSLGNDRPAARLTYRRWLARRADALRTDPTLFQTFAGHAFVDAVNDADVAAAATLITPLRTLLHARYRIDLDNPLPLPAEISGVSLARLAELMPLNLPAILMAHAICRLHTGEPRAVVRPLFIAAATAATALRRALAERMIEDGETEDIAWVATAETVLCDAEAGAPDLLPRLAALAPAPGEANGIERRRDIVRRAFTSLVNARRYEPAHALAAAEALVRDADASLLTRGPLPTSKRDALFSLAVLEVQPGGNPARARALFARVRSDLDAATQPVPGLFWAALRGEILAAESQGTPSYGTALLASTLAELGPAAAQAPPDLAARIVEAACRPT